MVSALDIVNSALAAIGRAPLAQNDVHVVQPWERGRNIVMCAAEREFVHVLRSLGRDAPAFESMLVEADPVHTGVIFTATFSSPPERSWRIDWRDLHEEDIRLPELPCTLVDPFAELYSRLFENHLLDLELQVIREQVSEFARLCPDPAQLGQFERYAYERMDHIRRHHRQNPPMFYNIAFEAEANDSAPVELGPVDLRNLLAGEISGRPMTATEVRMGMQEHVARLHRMQQRFLDEYAAVGMALMPGHSADIGSKQAQDRGLALLKQWLTPAQAKQYDKHKYFDVIGSDTGKRYRIRHGRQMNIDELDKKGKKVCGWCFLPQGQLVAGDVMLAQKIALETDETETLKVANKFGEALGEPVGPVRHGSHMYTAIGNQVVATPI